MNRKPDRSRRRSAAHLAPSRVAKWKEASVYDPKTEAHEFIGATRERGGRQGGALLRSRGSELAIAEPGDRCRGLGGRVIVVATPRARARRVRAGRARAAHASGGERSERGDRGDRGGRATGLRARWSRRARPGPRRSAGPWSARRRAAGARGRGREPAPRRSRRGRCTVKTTSAGRAVGRDRQSAVLQAIGAVLLGVDRADGDRPVRDPRERGPTSSSISCAARRPIAWPAARVARSMHSSCSRTRRRSASREDAQARRARRRRRIAAPARGLSRARGAARCQAGARRPAARSRSTR